VSKIIEEIKQFHLKTAKEKIQNSKLLENLQNVLNEIFSSFGKIVQEWILN
jgi:hypothetical protein